MPRHRINRRSFLARVAGAAASGGALVTMAAPAQAQVTDHDPSDPIGRGRGGGTGVTDSDSGAGADPVGRGRGGGPRPGATGVSDSDSGAYADAAGRGRGGTGMTDRDSGAYADPPGRGRGGQRGPSESSPYDPAARDLRCENNRQRYAELSRDGDTPETWSEAQLRTALADRNAADAAAIMQSANASGDQTVSDSAWAMIDPVARRYRYPLTRYGNWNELSPHIFQLIHRAQTSPSRAERLRQLQEARNNLAALGC